MQHKEECLIEVVYICDDVQHNIILMGKYLVTSFEKDLVVFVTPEFNWDKQVSSVCSKANVWCKIISKCFIFKSRDLIRKL